MENGIPRFLLFYVAEEKDPSFRVLLAVLLEKQGGNSERDSGGRAF